ncbi:MAG: GNAT family N-acetyltransferase, partial [candidate division Zixibacteria bacterium]|nr:GNAT family N-acetyltransferase [candidate division Zixibacteria bacterium]
MDGMYLTDLRLSVDIAADVDIVEVPSDNPGTAVETFAVGFGAPLEVSRHFHRWISLAGKTLRTRVYLARIDGVRDPVACAYTTYFPDRPVALLGGAATLEDYRGRGIYTALLERRLADVRADGLEATIILADHSTSASICSHAGLTKACELGFHYWTADTI